MVCKPNCKVCDKLIISQSVTFAGGNLVVNLPAGTYGNRCKYCIVIAQAIPADVTINAPVVITIGTGTEQYPLTNRCCAQVTACGIRTRTRYSAVVSTNASGGRLPAAGEDMPVPGQFAPRHQRHGPRRFNGAHGLKGGNEYESAPKNGFDVIRA